MAGDHLPTRRGAILTALAAGAAATVATEAHAVPAGAAPRDWDFLVGRWNVRHRKLRARLAGSTEWDAFDGTCVNWAVLGEQGNMDDNVLEAPGGTYHALSVRVFDPATGRWSIWWVDSRFPETIGVPVTGGFKACRRAGRERH